MERLFVIILGMNVSHFLMVLMLHLLNRGNIASSLSERRILSGLTQNNIGKKRIDKTTAIARAVDMISDKL